MYKFLAKNGQALAFGLGMLLVILFLVTALPATGSVNFETMSDTEKYNSNIFSVGLYAALVLAVIAAIGMVLFGVIQMASSFKTSWKGIAGFVAILVIFFIAYSTVDTAEASEPYMQGAIDKFEANGSVFTMDNFRFISASVITALAMLALSTLAFLGALVVNFFK